MKVLYRRHRALILALVPAPYLLLQSLLFLLANVWRSNPETDALLWQSTSAVAYTMFVMGPPCFFCTGISCFCRSVQKLRRKEEVRKHAILIPVALATVVLSAVYFWHYWYV